MNIEAGRYYRTRDGRWAYVSAIIEPSPFSGVACHLLAAGWIDGSDFPLRWNATGTLHTHRDDGCDLITEWLAPLREPLREPRQETRELVMYDGGVVACVGVCFGSPPPQYKVLARKWVTITEGEFE